MPPLDLLSSTSQMVFPLLIVITQDLVEYLTSKIHADFIDVDSGYRQCITRNIRIWQCNMQLPGVDRMLRNR